MQEFSETVAESTLDLVRRQHQEHGMPSMRTEKGHVNLCLTCKDCWDFLDGCEGGGIVTGVKSPVAAEERTWLPVHILGWVASIARVT